METTTTLVSTIELQQIVYSLTKHVPQVCVRFRLLGGLWYPNFLQVISLPSGGAIHFRDAQRQEDIFLPDLSNVAQFELDGKFGDFEPHCHYQVSSYALV